MATGNVYSSDEDVTLENLKQNIIEIKFQMSEKTESLKKMLDDARSELFIQLDEIFEQTENSYLLQKKQRLEHLIKGKAETRKLFSQNQNKPLLDKLINEIDQEIASIKTSFNIDVPVVSVYWREEKVIRAFTKLCDLRESYGRYKHKSGQKWEMSDTSTDEGLIGSVRGLKIDKLNGDIYVIDKDMNRLQVYTIDGAYIKTITDPVLKKPQYLCMNDTHIFVSCFVKHNFSMDNLFKFNKDSGNLESQIQIDEVLTGITEDNGEIFVCQLYNQKLSVFNENLVEQHTVTLTSPHFQSNTYIWDLQACNNLLYIYAANSTYSIQTFNKLTGELVTTLISQAALPNDCFHFCMDSNHNIITSLHEPDMIIIFGSDGNLQKIYGRIETYELHNPSGIDCYNGLIVVCQNKDPPLKAI